MYGGVKLGGRLRRGMVRNGVELTTEGFRKEKAVMVACLKAMGGSNGMRQEK